MSAVVDALIKDLCETLDDPGQRIGAANGKARYDLFHAANSICSHKVRVVLAQLEIPYRSHVLNIFAGQTFLPSHVRLRLMGCARSGLALVQAHTGSTAASSGGCDPAVVPTLIDRQLGEVIVDSKAICRYLDAQAGKPNTLCPSALRAPIEAELDIVDNLPNYQMLVGKPVGEDQRPRALQANDGAAFSMSKVERCDRYMTQFAADERLVKAYGAKRSKELMAAQTLFSQDAVAGAYAKADDARGQLNERLKATAGAWLFGDVVTMADLFWAVELLRMKNLGAETLWQGSRLPAVDAFVTAAERLPSIQAAVLTWPGALF